MSHDVFRGRLAFCLVALAALYATGLLVWIAVAEDFRAVWLAIFAQPLLVTLVMWAILRRRCTTGSAAATTAAWILAPLYLVWSVIAGFSLAAGALPAALLLALAAWATPRGPPTHAR